MTSINNNQSVNALNSQIDNILASYGVNDKEELDALFTDMSTFNEGNVGAQKITNQIGQLQAKIEDLEKQAQKILEDIQGKQDEVDKNADELAQNASDLKTTTESFQAKAANAARMAARDAIQSYKNGKGDADFKECYEQAFNKRIGGLSANQKEIQALYDLFEANQAKITNISDAIQDGLDKIAGLEGQLQNIQGTISMLTRTKNIMENSTVDDAYKNIDTNSDVPVFSGKKAEVANAILNAYQTRNEASVTNTATQEADPAQKEAAKNKFLDAKEGTYKSGDKYSAQQNPELMNLRNLIANGMIEELQASGMNAEEIMQFVSSNWNVGISKQGNGNWKIPKGHSSDAWVKEPAFVALSNMIEGGSTAKTADSVNPNQMAELQKAINEDNILKTMYEAGFTFKEAMYTLTKAFPNAGIEYDLSDQNGSRTYSKVADTENSNGLYKKIGDDILKYWNVGGKAATEGDDSTTGEVDKFDPITFQQGDTTYTFITDRNNDGTFDYTDGKNNDLLGSKDGISELTAFDTNNDGKISGDELKNLTVMANQQEESVANKGDVDNYKNGPSYTNAVDFNMSYSTAADLGITEIDLSKLQNGTGTGEVLGDSTKTYDGHQEEYEDINGSSVINQFDIKMNGETINAKETLNTEENLETFYGKVADASNNAGKITTKADQDEFDDAFANTEGSDIIDNVKEQLEAMKDQQPEVLDIIGGIEITDEDIHNMTGTAYLTGIKNAGRIAAEKHLGNENDAADASEEAVNDYFEERIFGKNGVKEEDEED